ncbi:MULTISPECIES: MaoC/PaaZ C-terminal domain-containing protein [unclassified Streptomyces]|uniref:MaoC/PaaZ C-terminal domain-containing protein n=1 Tax=unclassified Streptomyces TaxID=2593676 RepID=UPI002E29C17C|nr:MaoC/PaaZ C-terminal domain-containing protein [Streptomyces sp. NBC_00223]
MSEYDITVGQAIPVFTRTTGFANWNRYAAVNDEFVPIHMDDEAGRAAGYATAFGMGNLQWAYLHNVLREWLPGARIVRLACQFRSPNTKGMVVTAKGTVTAVRDADGGREVDVEVWTEDQDGNRLAPGTATLLLN